MLLSHNTWESWNRESATDIKHPHLNRELCVRHTRKQLKKSDGNSKAPRALPSPSPALTEPGRLVPPPGRQAAEQERGISRYRLQESTVESKGFVELENWALTFKPQICKEETVTQTWQRITAKTRFSYREKWKQRARKSQWNGWEQTEISHPSSQRVQTMKEINRSKPACIGFGWAAKHSTTKDALGQINSSSANPNTQPYQIFWSLYTIAVSKQNKPPQFFPQILSNTFILGLACMKVQQKYKMHISAAGHSSSSLRFPFPTWSMLLLVQPMFLSR